MLRHTFASLVACLTWAGASLGADGPHASPVAGRPVTLWEAVERARAHSPELLPASAEQAASGNVGKAADSLFQHPMRLELGAGPRFLANGRRDWDATIGVWQDVSLAGLRGARQLYARDFAALTRENLAARRAETGTAAALAWVDLRLAQELEGIRNRALDDANELLHIAEARVSAGRSEPAEATLARAVVGAGQAAVLDAEGLRVSAEAELSYLTGLEPEQRLEATGELDSTAFDATKASNGATSPALRAARASAVLNASAAQLAQSSGGAFLSVGPTLTKEGTGDYIVELRVALPLPTVNPAALDSAILRAQAARAHADADRLARLVASQYRVFAHEREHARETRDTLQKGAVAPAREAVRLQALRYRSGSAELSASLVARGELSNAEERWARAAAEVRRADLKMLGLLGLIAAPEGGK